VRKYFNNLNIIIIFGIFLSSESGFAQLGSCPGNSEAPIFLENFGTGLQDIALPTGTTTYNYANGGEPLDGIYTVTSNTSYFDWFDVEDQTPNDTDGRMLVVNSSFAPGEFYRTPIDGLCENTSYEFSSWILNLTPAGGFCGAGVIPVNVRFEIWDNTDTNLLASGNTGNINSTSSPVWEQYALVFQTIPSQTSVILKMINNGSGGCGNDLAIDDIAFSACGDFIAVTDTNNNVQIEICEDETPFDLLLTATPDFSVYNSHFYQWQESTDGLVWTDILGETNETINVSVNESIFYRTKVAEDAINLDNPQCISISDIFQADVIQSPETPITLGDVSFDCNLNEANLVVSVPMGILVNWYDSALNGNVLSLDTTTFVAMTEGVYFAEAIDQTTGCISIGRTAVNAFVESPNPPIANGDVGLDCETNEVELLVDVPPGVQVNWYDSEINGILLEANSTAFVATELGVFYAEAVDEITGCASTTRTAVSVLSELQTGNCIIPQGISPGVSLGFNDTFDLSGFEVSKLQIYNRYGTLVYSKNDYTNEWFGQSKDGDELPVGTYFYIMEYQQGKQRTAWVYLNR
jgi:gliding motility-associated-like protein